MEGKEVFVKNPIARAWNLLDYLKGKDDSEEMIKEVNGIIEYLSRNKRLIGKKGQIPAFIEIKNRR